MSSLPKIIVIVGPTAVGKTALAIQLAKELGGQILSADSRQIYRGMPIGTGCPPGQWRPHGSERAYFVNGVAHFGLDYVSPDTAYSVADFQTYAHSVINGIITRGHLPLVVGGTGLYVSAVVNNFKLPAGQKNNRDQWQNLALPDLLGKLQKIDPAGYEFVDKNNKRRVIRALEVALSGGSIARRQRQPAEYDVLQIGLTLPRQKLVSQINERVDSQVASGFLKEAQTILKKFSLRLPSLSGIGYNHWASFLAGEMTQAAAVNAIKTSTRQYAKRQMTWFKKDPQIIWFDPNDIEPIKERIKKFLNINK